MATASASFRLTQKLQEPMSTRGTSNKLLHEAPPIDANHLASSENKMHCHHDTSSDLPYVNEVNPNTRIRSYENDVDIPLYSKQRNTTQQDKGILSYFISLVQKTSIICAAGVALAIWVKICLVDLHYWVLSSARLCLRLLLCYLLSACFFLIQSTSMHGVLLRMSRAYRHLGQWPSQVYEESSFSRLHGASPCGALTRTTTMIKQFFSLMVSKISPYLACCPAGFGRHRTAAEYCRKPVFSVTYKTMFDCINRRIQLKRRPLNSIKYFSERPYYRRCHRRRARPYMTCGSCYSHLSYTRSYTKRRPSGVIPLSNEMLGKAAKRYHNSEKCTCCWSPLRKTTDEIFEGGSSVDDVSAT